MLGILSSYNMKIKCCDAVTNNDALVVWRYAFKILDMLLLKSVTKIELDPECNFF